MNWRGREGNIPNKRKPREGGKRRSKGQLKMERIRGYVKLISTLYFEILHTVLFVSFFALVDLHASDWLEELKGLVRVMALFVSIYHGATIPEKHRAQSKSINR